MATSEVVLTSAAPRKAPQLDAGTGAWITGVLSVFAIVIHGYHPYAEDGGLYLAGIKRVLDPSLYPAHAGFVTTHLRFSLFAPLVAGIARLSGIPLMVVMLFVYVSTTWLTLYAGWRIAALCVPGREGRVGAVALLAITLTIPVAGTSLMLMDPYVTARSLSLPCGLLAISFVLEAFASTSDGTGLQLSSIVACAVNIVIAALMHPLMAFYTVASIAVLICLKVPNARLRLSAILAGCTFTFVVAGALDKLAPAHSYEYGVVASTRTYWFLAQWKWYELLGLLGPIAILIMLRAWGDKAKLRLDRTDDAGAALASMCAITGAAAVIIAASFARYHSPSLLVARVQPLRIYQNTYALMIISLGAYLGANVLRTKLWRWAVLMAPLAALMALVQYNTFPASNHVELPWIQQKNGWQQAFLWIATHTPKRALFALDARYTQAAGEDSQNFRALAERSSLPDYSKDGGVASISPQLTHEWTIGEKAQEHANSEDQGRILDLRTYGVTWVVLPVDAPARIDCAYRNQVAKVCQLPQLNEAAGLTYGAHQ